MFVMGFMKRESIFITILWLSFFILFFQSVEQEDISERLLPKKQGKERRIEEWKKDEFKCNFPKLLKS